jgi:HK97 family phage portal protein
MLPPFYGTLTGLGPWVWDATTARRIPAISKALDVYSGMVKQMPMDAYRGIDPLPRPRLLDRPDPTQARSWFVHVQLEDYWLQGNAVHVVTSRNVEGWPASVMWLPAVWVTITWSPGQPAQYWALGSPLPPEDVVHVKRGADRWYPVRGVGVVEQFLGELDRMAMESDYGRNALAGGAVPSVAVITNNAKPQQDELDLAKASWLEKFAGPTREPAFLPAGTQIIPLGWSPSDAQLTQARQLSMQDAANMFNLDGFWTGAPASAMTYRNAGPMYQNLLRTSIEPVLADFEDTWSDAWLPRGSHVRFDRSLLLRDDLATTTTVLTGLVAAQIITINEARAYLALPTATGEIEEVASITSPVDTVAVAKSAGDVEEPFEDSGGGESMDDEGAAA